MPTSCLKFKKIVQKQVGQKSAEDVPGTKAEQTGGAAVSSDGSALACEHRPWD